MTGGRRQSVDGRADAERAWRAAEVLLSTQNIIGSVPLFLAVIGIDFTFTAGMLLSRHEINTPTAPARRCLKTRSYARQSVVAPVTWVGRGDRPLRSVSAEKST